jgi:cellulose synthase/poly-beta-1,6-N-acetylglucosamine synthase-like glycosyltransferase/exo-beta-1,3-glucanase (GH17 family)
MRSLVSVVALVACLHALAWAIWQTQASAPNIEGVLNSVSYSPFLAHPDDICHPPTEAQIRSDLKAIAPYTRAIRLYKSTNGFEQIPAIANEFGLKVTLGVSLNYTKKEDDISLRCIKKPAERMLEFLRLQERETVEEEIKRNEERNEREISAAIDLARKNRNVNGIVVGNETIYRGVYLSLEEIKDQIRRDAYHGGWAPKEKNAKEENVYLSLEEIKKRIRHDDEIKDRIEHGEKIKDWVEWTPTDGGYEVNDLIKIIQRVKRETDGRVPVTTGEIHSNYTDHPELGFSVDYIAAHILPYWNSIPAAGAVDQAVRVYNDLRRDFKGKRVVIAEFGWPSGGYNRQSSVPGKLEQASVIRSFLSRAQALGMDYNVIEAFDQPWKTSEGSVGAYWGLFDSSHHLKFAWTGPIVDDGRGNISTLAVAVGALVSLPILVMAGATMTQALLLAMAAHGIGAWSATVFEYWNGHYFVFGTGFALSLGMFLLVPLVVITLRRIDEMAVVLFGRPPQRLLPAGNGTMTVGFNPKVSIHIPAYMEPPQMLKATLDAVARLNYQNFECIIVVNNTPSPTMWQPVEEHCRTLGERFRFVNAPRLDGYKAGALRLAMAHTAADAEIIGIIDSDYAVAVDWLSDLVPVFADPGVGLVQAPQDHRDGERSPLHHVMNGEYAGFFDVGMVQRNETNAIIVHGTMCLIRRAALERAGGWSSDTICEDTDLGLTILEQGWLAHYTNRRYGRGLLPDTFEAYKKQRDRWASGGFQIVRKHWRAFLPGASLLTPDQKREFVFGWVNWLGAESVGVLVAIFNLVWVPVVAFAGIAVPDKVLTLPIIATFAISIVHFITLYRRRVPIPLGQTAGAMVAAMAMQWTVARAVANSIIKDHLPFVRTAKGGKGARPRRVAFPAFNEAILGGLLVLGALIVFQRNHEQVQEINLFGCVLLVQSLPFLAAVALAAFENSRINDFVLWNAIETKVVQLLPRELLPRRNRIAEASAAPEKRMEAAP